LLLGDGTAYWHVGAELELLGTLALSGLTPSVTGQLAAGGRRVPGPTDATD